MKNFQHPEFHILHKLQLLKEKHPDIEELSGLVDEVRDIINENSLTIMQDASLYTLLGQPGDLRPDTKAKLGRFLPAALKCLDLDDTPS